ncbi:MAG: PHP domain-containing protein [Clostridiales bacterium]|nr:PHP domain-containing protein [Clostridiales bacterium]
MSKFFGDYHTHTYYSDGLNSPKSLLEMAKEQGYKEIAITDHGLANKIMGLTRAKIDKLSCDIESLRQEYPDITIYQGYEGDLISFDGSTDIYDDIMEKMDIIILGFHRYIKPKYFKEVFTFVFRNGFLAKWFGSSKKLIEKNTNALLTALKSRRVNILAHINHNMKVDCKKVATFCAEQGIYVEINIKHLNIMEKVIGEILATGCLFIANTDTHNVKRSNNLNKIYDFITKHNIPHDRVVNLGKAPNFAEQFTKKI